MSSIVFSDVILVDGTGGAQRRADVAVFDDLIAAVTGPGELGTSTADRVIRGGGRVLAPGFIDAHSHADSAPFLHHDDDSKISQGVTTEVVGNCGFSLAPAPTERLADTKALTGRIFPPLDFDWTTTAELFSRTDAAGYMVNTVPLVGHSTIRSAVLGGSDQPAEPAAVEAMRAQLAASMEAGAWGLSTGLIYAPGMYASREEITALVYALPPDAIYTTHMRGEGAQLLESLEEALDVARQTGRRLQISHLKAAGSRARGSMDRALALLDTAHDEGVDVSHDVYPYEANSTMLIACLPPWFLAGDHAEIMYRLGSPQDLHRARADVERDDGTWENWVAGSGWDQVRIASTATHQYEGMNLGQVASQMRADPFDALVTVLLQNDLAATMNVFAMSEADVDAAVRHPRAMIGSDGLPPGTGGKPHPRLYGTFTRVLSRYVRDRPLLSLPEAVAMMTSRPARTFGLVGRGTVTPGNVADLVLFDPSLVADRATFDDPQIRSAGIDLVLVNGQVAYSEGTLSGRRAGRRLRLPTRSAGTLERGRNPQ